MCGFNKHTCAFLWGTVFAVELLIVGCTQARFKRCCRDIFPDRTNPEPCGSEWKHVRPRLPPPAAAACRAHAPGSAGSVMLSRCGSPSAYLSLTINEDRHLLKCSLEELQWRNGLARRTYKMLIGYLKFLFGKLSKSSFFSWVIFLSRQNYNFYIFWIQVLYQI